MRAKTVSLVILSLTAAAFAGAAVARPLPGTQATATVSSVAAANAARPHDTPRVDAEVECTTLTNGSKDCKTTMRSTVRRTRSTGSGGGGAMDETSIRPRWHSALPGMMR